MSVKQPRTRKFMAHEPGFTIIDAMNRLFPAWFDGESCWDAWRVILKAAFALPMTKDEVAFFRTIAGDRDPQKIKSGDFVFPGQVRNKPLSSMAMEMVFRRMKLENVTVHGFRSASATGPGTSPTSHMKS